MSRDARNEDVALSPAARKLFDELVKVAAAERFGQEPPRETTFAEIEKYGHLVGRMLARAVDTEVVANHALSHFQEEQRCPKCNEKQPPKESPHELLLQTSDGEVALDEPAFRCPPCERDFFPARLPLKLDGGGSSPQVLAQKIVATAHTSSYSTGARLLKELADIHMRPAS